MIRVAMVLLLPLTAFASDDPNHAALMDEIEATVVLPAKAHPLADYGRHYALQGPAHVLAIYVIPPRPLGPDVGCTVSDRNGSHACSAEEVAETRRSNDASIAWFMPKGGRRWYKNERNMPNMDDGGCQQVTIEYDSAAKRVLSAACNGPG